ncbi:IS66 family insertion sequence element accessory protein TnpB [Thioalkalicoccus limnaeus]|uniref:IS66 family insertion sequence element accessory protein TnpB n=1 Tax=Thioalkalicoccus limnaeus TaxID=120681 RepID=A0ABV4BB46_9GAMM
MATTKTGVRRSRAEWQALLERAERSRLSTVAFCAAEGISTASFYLWRKRLGASNPPQGDVGEEAPEFLDLGLGSGVQASGEAAFILKRWHAM